MATIVNAFNSRLCHSRPELSVRRGRNGGASARPAMIVRAQNGGINPDIRKAEEKVVDSVEITELSKPLTAYCRCWRSRTFPLCDGSHVKHNKATGDNVGPLLLKKPKS